MAGATSATWTAWAAGVQSAAGRPAVFAGLGVENPVLAVAVRVVALRAVEDDAGRAGIALALMAPLPQTTPWPAMWLEVVAVPVSRTPTWPSPPMEMPLVMVAFWPVVSAVMAGSGIESSVADPTSRNALCGAKENAPLVAFFVTTMFALPVGRPVMLPAAVEPL